MIDIRPGTRKDLFKPVYLINEHGKRILKQTETKKGLADFFDSLTPERQEEINKVLNFAIKNERFDTIMQMMKIIKEERLEKEKLYQPAITKIGDALADLLKSQGDEKGASDVKELFSKLTIKE